jgi:hypothetical protein
MSTELRGRIGNLLSDRLQPLHEDLIAAVEYRPEEADG